MANQAARLATASTAGPLAARGVELRLLVPDDVFAGFSRDQQIEVAILVHIQNANVVGRLVLADDAGCEIAFAVSWEYRVGSRDVFRPWLGVMVCILALLWSRLCECRRF